MNSRTLQTLDDYDVSIQVDQLQSMYYSVGDIDIEEVCAWVGAGGLWETILLRSENCSKKESLFKKARERPVEIQGTHSGHSKPTSWCCLLGWLSTITTHDQKRSMLGGDPQQHKNVSIITPILQLIVIESRFAQYQISYWWETVNSLDSQLAHRKWIKFWNESNSFISLLQIHSLASGLWLLVKNKYKTFKFNVEVK